MLDGLRSFLISIRPEALRGPCAPSLTREEVVGATLRRLHGYLSDYLGNHHYKHKDDPTNVTVIKVSFAGYIDREDLMADFLTDPHYFGVMALAEEYNLEASLKIVPPHLDRLGTAQPPALRAAFRTPQKMSFDNQSPV